MSKESLAILAGKGKPLVQKAADSGDNPKTPKPNTGKGKPAPANANLAAPELVDVTDPKAALIGLITKHWYKLNPQSYILRTSCALSEGWVPLGVAEAIMLEVAQVVGNDFSGKLPQWVQRGYKTSEPHSPLQNLEELFKEDRLLVEQLLKQLGTPKADASKIDYVARLIKGQDWDKLKFPPRVELVKGVFFENSLNMVFGDTGIGKSWFCLELGVCIAQGRDFLAWETTVEKRPVIYIDAELTPDQLQKRIVGLAPKRPDHFLVYSVLQHAKPGEPDFNINSPKIQKAVEQMAAEVKPALIVFDNLSKLVKGFNKNDGHDWEGFLTWCDNLRATGPAILIVHHSGKSGDQLGSKTQEIGLETNIELKRTGDQRFRIGFKKTRNQPPTPNSLEVEIKTEDGITTLAPGEWTPQADDHMAAVVCTLADGYSGTQKGLAKKADVHESSVKRIVPKLRANGHLPEKGWALTAKGKEFAAFSCGWGVVNDL